MDRENVIKALDICVNGNGCKDGIPNPLCPYSSKVGCDLNQILADALTILKEQEAVKPYIDIDEAKCPICKVKLTRQELIGEDVLFEDFFDYCPRCGRKVKWQ